jgi:hypothetical protein
MTIRLTARQQEIMATLRAKDGGLNASAFQKLEQQCLEFSDIEVLCNIINEEFLMKGILPSFEPNEYGLELEALLDVINHPRICPVAPATTQ